MKNRIRAVRQSKGVSQPALAALIDTTPASISRYEREDGRVTLTLLMRIADALQCDPLELLSEHAPTQPSVVSIPRLGGAPDLSLDQAEAARLGLTSTTRAVTVEDDAMSPAIPRGATCFTDISITAHSGSGLYLLGSEQPSIRRLSRSAISGFVIVSTDNPAYPNEGEYSEDTVSVAGRVVATIVKV